MASATRFKTGWKIRWSDGDGKTRQICVSGLNQRQAENFARHCGVLNAAKISNSSDIDRQTSLWLQGLGQSLHDKLAAAGLVEQRRCFTVAEWVGQYIEGRAVKDRTRIIMRQAAGNLLARLGDLPIQSVTESHAVAFKAWLVSASGAGLAENTARRRCGHARQFFAAAMREGLTERNPFAAVSVAVGAASGKHRFITADDTRRILDACPCQDWRTIVALARWGGLRCPSEVLALTWADIDWKENRISVPEPKVEHHAGRGRRVVPLFPELREVLADAFELAAEGAVFVVNRYRDGRATNMRTTFGKILDRAGVPRFERPFCNLRSSRVTELRQKFDPKVVATWLGHSESISTKHYTQVRPEDFAAAVSFRNPVDIQVDMQTSESDRTAGNSKRKNPEKLSVFPGSAGIFAGIREAEVLRVGFETPPKNTGKTVVSESSRHPGRHTAGTVDLAAALQALAALSPEQLAGLLSLSKAAAVADHGVASPGQ
jgi:integrase